MFLLFVPSFDYLNSMDIYNMILSATMLAEHRHTQIIIRSHDIEL